jgi:hypothetical protein
MITKTFSRAAPRHGLRCHTQRMGGAGGLADPGRAVGGGVRRGDDPGTVIGEARALEFLLQSPPPLAMLPP